MSNSASLEPPPLPQPVRVLPVGPGLPLQGLGLSLDDRARRAGLFAVILGSAGALLSVVTLMTAGDRLATSMNRAVESRAVREAMFIGVPVFLSAFFVPLAGSGLRLRGGGLGDLRPASGSTRRTLTRMRGLLVYGMLLTLLATVLGLMGRHAESVLTVGVVHAAAFVGSALLAARVRDLLSDTDAAELFQAGDATTATAPPFPPSPVLPLAEPDRPSARPDVMSTSAHDDGPPLAALAPALPIGELQYASGREDGARDFLRLFDLLAIFGAVLYGLQVPLLADALANGGAMTLGRLTAAPGRPAPAPLHLANVLVMGLSFVAAVGWAVWGAVYVAFGPVLYRLSFALAAVGVAAATLRTGFDLLGAPSAVGRRAAELAWLGPSMHAWLFPAVMLFCLTRPRVRAAFADRRPSGGTRGSRGGNSRPSAVVADRAR